MPPIASRTANRIAQVLTAGELLVLALVAPALLFPTPDRSLALLVLPGLWLAARAATGGFAPRTPFDLSVLALLAMVLVSLFAAFDLANSLPKVAGLLWDVAVFYALVRWTTTPGRLRLGLLGFAFAGAGLSLLGLAGIDWLVKWPALVPVIRLLPVLVRGLPGAEEGFQPNAVAGILVLCLPVQLALLFPGRAPGVPQPASAWPRWAERLLPWLLGLALAVTAFTVLLTQSRGALLGLGVALLALAAWRARRPGRLILVVVGAAAAAGVVLGPARLAQIALDAGGAGLLGSAASRLELWSRALTAIHDFPLTGLGMNSFRHVVRVLYPLFLTSPEYDIAHAHNHFLQAALDLGLPGLAAYVSLWLTASHLLLRAHGSGGSSLMRTLAEGLGAGLLAHFLFSLTDVIPLGAKISLFFWVALALVAAAAQVSASCAALPGARPPADTLEAAVQAHG